MRSSYRIVSASLLMTAILTSMVLACSSSSSGDDDLGPMPPDASASDTSSNSDANHDTGAPVDSGGGPCALNPGNYQSSQSVVASVGANCTTDADGGTITYPQADSGRNAAACDGTFVETTTQGASGCTTEDKCTQASGASLSYSITVAPDGNSATFVVDLDGFLSDGGPEECKVGGTLTQE